MKIEYRDGLLFVYITLEYGGLTQTVPNIILDTGAAQSLIASEAVESLNIQTGDSDIIVPMVGIGGRDYALRKQIEGLTFGRYHIPNPFVDFGNLEAHPGINGLLGSDILVHGRFVIDLATLEIYQRTY